MFNVAHWFIHGEIDWENVQSKLRNISPFLSGALFGTAWAFWIDALVYTKTVLHESYPFTYNLPGIVATLALIMMNLVSRDDLSSMQDTYNSDEGSEGRAKIWLFISYCVAFGAVAGSVAVLVTCVQNGKNVEIGVGGLVQSGLILVAALLLWGFRTEDEGYGFIH